MSTPTNEHQDLTTDHGRPIGMNTPGYDNRQLALNIMHWLTRLM